MSIYWINLEKRFNWSHLREINVHSLISIYCNHMADVYRKKVIRYHFIIKYILLMQNKGAFVKFFIQNTIMLQ